MALEEEREGSAGYNVAACSVSVACISCRQTPPITAGTTRNKPAFGKGQIDKTFPDTQTHIKTIVRFRQPTSSNGTLARISPCGQAPQNRGYRKDEENFYVRNCEA